MAFIMWASSGGSPAIAKSFAICCCPSSFFWPVHRLLAVIRHRINSVCSSFVNAVPLCSLANSRQTFSRGTRRNRSSACFCMDCACPSLGGPVIINCCCIVAIKCSSALTSASNKASKTLSRSTSSTSGALVISVTSSTSVIFSSGLGFGTVDCAADTRVTGTVRVEPLVVVRGAAAGAVVLLMLLDERGAEADAVARVAMEGCVCC
mmetsp:Transcript_77054/g.135912  ORF Transcript_77054/g.135912 Transcript_77054/m.135912 type:complete len:207 (+) Transcript_77054:1932-2552(+)